MTTKFTHSSMILIAGLVVIAISGCSNERNSTGTSAGAPTSERSGSPQTPAVLNDALEDYSFDRQDEFASQFRAMLAEMDAQVSEFLESHPEEQAEGATRTAIQELKSAQTDFKKKLEAAGTAGAETWNTARSSVTAAWDRLETALAMAKAAAIGQQR